MVVFPSFLLLLLKNLICYVKRTHTALPVVSEQIGAPTQKTSPLKHNPLDIFRSIRTIQAVVYSVDYHLLRVINIPISKIRKCRGAIP